MKKLRSNRMEKSTKWLIVGIISSIFNPVPTGLVLGYVIFTEPELKNVGKITILLSFLFTLIWLSFLIVPGGWMKI